MVYINTSKDIQAACKFYSIIQWSLGVEEIAVILLFFDVTTQVLVIEATMVLSSVCMISEPLM
jgi:hypothetical protein